MFSKDGIVKEIADEVTRVAAFADAYSAESRRDLWRIEQFGAPTSKDILGVERTLKALGAVLEERVAIICRKRVAGCVPGLVVAVAVADKFDRVRVLARAHAKVQPHVDLGAVGIVEARHEQTDLLVYYGYVVGVDDNAHGDLARRRCGQRLGQRCHDRV